MSVYKSHGLLSGVSVILLCLAWIVAVGEAQGGELYEYFDKDGTVVITDSPPPGADAKILKSLPKFIEEPKAASEKEGNDTSQRDREADAIRKDREENINAVREELEQARRDEQHYRSNMNQASSYAQRQRWRTLVDEQLKLIEEKQKKLDDLDR
jgi:hypothetical protein